MFNKQITRRVFIGATTYLVTAAAFSTEIKPKTKIQLVKGDGQFFNAKQLTVLADVAEIMIPKTDTPGAYDAHVISVLDAMMQSWAGEQTQKQFVLLVEEIEGIAQNTYKKSYSALEQEKRIMLLEVLDERAFKHLKTPISNSYRKLKSIIFHLYYTSEEANPDYRLVPGTYKGCLSRAELDAILKRGYA